MARSDFNPQKLYVFTNRKSKTLFRNLWFDRLWVHQKNGKCAYCEQQMNSHYSNNGLDPTMDHIVPKSLGGRYHISNILLACQKCNTTKQNMVWTPKFITLNPT